MRRPERHPMAASDGYAFQSEETMASGQGDGAVMEPQDLLLKLKRMLLQRKIHRSRPTSEVGIANDLRVNRATVREAALQLVERGLVVRSPRGICLREAEDQDFNEMLDIRGENEPNIAKKLAS